MTDKVSVAKFNLGPWENDIGYSQSVKIGNRIIVSGSVGNEETSKDVESQLIDAYNVIIKTLAHNRATLQNVVKETIYCKDMEALKKCIGKRKQFYMGNNPASTWVQVERLYSEGHLIEIEVEAYLE